MKRFGMRIDFKRSRRYVIGYTVAIAAGIQILGLLSYYVADWIEATRSKFELYLAYTAYLFLYTSNAYIANKYDLLLLCLQLRYRQIHTIMG